LGLNYIDILKWISRMGVERSYFDRKDVTKYSSVSVLKQLLVEDMKQKMPEVWKTELWHEFDNMDTDRDGFINLKELTNYLYKERGNYEEAKARASSIIKQFDQDGDNQISKHEWWAARVSTTLGYDSITKETFERLDDNGDGYISVDELAKFFNLPR